MLSLLLMVASTPFDDDISILMLTLVLSLVLASVVKTRLYTMFTMVKGLRGISNSK